MQPTIIKFYAYCESESEAQELEKALIEAQECGHGYVIDCAINIDEMVRPMVGGGSPITNFMLD